MGRRSLLRVLGVGFGIAGAIGGTVGAGIFRTPGEVAAELPAAGPYLLCWVIGGLYALLAAFGVSELATMMPRAGGQYVFARRALGRYAGFVVGWFDWVAASGGIAALSIFFADTVGEVLPALDGAATRKLVAGATLLAFALLQWLGVRSGAWAQKLTSLAKAAGLLALVVALLVFGEGGAPSAGGEVKVAAIFLVLPAVIWTYDGWYGPVYFGEEFERPERDLPRSILGSVVLVMALYLLYNVALLRVLPLDAIGRAKLPAAEATVLVIGPYGVRLVKALIALAVLSTINAMIMAAPRILYGMSKDGLLPEHVQSVNEGGTPTVALALTAVVAAAFLLSGTFHAVIAVVSFFIVAFIAVSLVSVFVLRRREPQASRPYRAFGHPFTTGLALLGSLAFFVGVAAADPRDALIAAAVLAASVPVYKLASGVN